MAGTFTNWIGGEARPALSGATRSVRNPARPDEVVASAPRSGAEDVAAAIAAARGACLGWARRSAFERAAVVARAARLLAERRAELALSITLEMGKPLSEAEAEIDEAVERAEAAAAAVRQPHGFTAASGVEGRLAMALREPVGVAGIVTPWNFPLSLAAWNLFPALVTGNTAVWKPDEATPGAAAGLVEVLVAAGVPPGVVNLVHGDGPEAGRALAADPGIDALSFTGSVEVGREVGMAAARNLVKCCLELGGKNAQLVLEDADLEAAVEGAVEAAFAGSGQRCDATSRVIVHERLAEAFTRRLVQRSRDLVVGDGRTAGVDLGPLVSEAALERVLGFVRSGLEEDHAELVAGGERVRPGGSETGWFMGPTVFAGVTPAMRIAQEEIFGPVVAILPVGSLEEAIRVANDVPLGLAASVWSRDLGTCMAAARELECGVVCVNAPTTGSELHLPFGGVKDSGNGRRSAGDALLDFYTEWKSVFVEVPGGLPRPGSDLPLGHR